MRTEKRLRNLIFNEQNNNMYISGSRSSPVRPLHLRRAPPPAELLLGAVRGRAEAGLRAPIQAGKVLSELRVQGEAAEEHGGGARIQREIESSF